MEFNTIYEVLLSENKYADYRVAKIIHMTGTTKRNGIPHKYSIIRLELSAFEDKKVPTSIQFANKDFEWFIDCFRKGSEKSSHVGRKKLIYATFGDDTHTIVSSENGRVYGIELMKREIEKLIKYEHLFKFIFEKQNITSKELTEIICNLYVSILGDKISEKLKNECDGCRDDSKTTPHTVCKQYFRSRDDKYILLENTMNSESVEMVSTNYFETLMDILNVKIPERIEQKQIRIPDLKKDLDLIINKLGYLIDFKEGYPKELMDILNLINTK